MSNEDFDYAAAAVRVLRAAGGPMKEDDFWTALMRPSTGLPDDDIERYYTGPFKPGPYPRSIVKFKIGMSIQLKTDNGFDSVADTELQDYNAAVSRGDAGFWLREWGPLPEDEQQFRRERDRRRAAPSSTASPKRGPEASATNKQQGACYIATAVYGSYDAPEVRILRDFRDERLSHSPAGRAFIRFYYAAGPAAADLFGSHSALTRAARTVLDAMVRRLDHRA